MTPEAFVDKWRHVSVKESAAAHSHFEDLCELLGVEKPLDADPDGDWYTYEKHVSKAVGGKGYADVWKKGYFAWEYKGKRKNLDDAYLQLLLYRDDLANPPLLIVSDLERIEIHTNFTGTNKRLYKLTLDDLLDSENRELLHKAFTDPEALNPQHQRQRITEDATARIGQIALKLRDRGHDPQRVAHFLMQLVFALFAEDVELLPNRARQRHPREDQGQPGARPAVPHHAVQRHGQRGRGPAPRRAATSTAGCSRTARPWNSPATSSASSTRPPGWTGARSSPPSSALCSSAPWTPRSAASSAPTTPAARTSCASSSPS